jgi:hypothetical protein
MTAFRPWNTARPFEQKPEVRKLLHFLYRFRWLKMLVNVSDRYPPCYMKTRMIVSMIPTTLRMSQEERSIFWEVIVSVILSRNMYMYMCSYSERFPRLCCFTIQFQNCWWENDITHCFCYRCCSSDRILTFPPGMSRISDRDAVSSSGWRGCFYPSLNVLISRYRVFNMVNFVSPIMQIFDDCKLVI